uniref:Uncharacterized protein n=1 Tax=Burkholderia sp. (strain CCGE1003) TaxID=640512 RepID=E1T3I8_BURSG
MRGNTALAERQTPQAGSRGETHSLKRLLQITDAHLTGVNN